MAIAIGDRLPEATFRVMTADGIKEMTTGDVFAGKKVVLFAVPGAFTPTCHLKHLPGFIESADEFKTLGIDTVACVAVNDPFVLGAWEEKSGGKGKVLFLSDGNAEFTKKIGMDFDGSGRRSRHPLQALCGAGRGRRGEGAECRGFAWRRGREHRRQAARPALVSSFFFRLPRGTAPCPRGRARRRARCRHGRHGP